MAIEPLKSLMGTLQQQPHWQTRRQFYQVVQHWPKAVGHLVARQSRPVSIQRQILYVSVSTAAWAQTLTFERQRILPKLNHWLACPLNDVRFSAAHWTTSAEPRRPTVDNELLRQHPSYVAPEHRAPESGALENPASDLAPGLATEDGRPSENATAGSEDSLPAGGAQQAFAQWSQRIQTSQQHQHLCPECQCYCPPGELKRWQMCALCIVKQWKDNYPLG
ncbi:MAG: DUF721 domain-containing protein [Cyanobacteria bacterium P01_A01_bin.105]